MEGKSKKDQGGKEAKGGKQKAGPRKIMPAAAYTAMQELLGVDKKTVPTEEQLATFVSGFEEATLPLVTEHVRSKFNAGQLEGTWLAGGRGGGARTLGGKTFMSGLGDYPTLNPKP